MSIIDLKTVIKKDPLNFKEIEIKLKKSGSDYDILVKDTDNEFYGTLYYGKSKEIAIENMIIDLVGEKYLNNVKVKKIAEFQYVCKFPQKIIREVYLPEILRIEAAKYIRTADEIERKRSKNINK